MFAIMDIHSVEMNFKEENCIEVSMYGKGASYYTHFITTVPIITPVAVKFDIDEIIKRKIKGCSIHLNGNKLDFKHANNTSLPLIVDSNIKTVAISNPEMDWIMMDLSFEIIEKFYKMVNKENDYVFKVDDGICNVGDNIIDNIHDDMDISTGIDPALKYTSKFSGVLTKMMFSMYKHYENFQIYIGDDCPMKIVMKNPETTLTMIMAPLQDAQ